MKKIKHIETGKEYEPVDVVNLSAFNILLVIYKDGKRVYVRDAYMFEKKFDTTVDEILKNMDKELNIQIDTKYYEV